MTRRAAASQVIVIHRWQIIVNQRIGVDHFERARGANQHFISCAKRLADCQQQRGTKTLASGKDAPANRRVHARRFFCFFGD